MTVRAKFRCNSVELHHEKPFEKRLYHNEVEGEVRRLIWPRTFRFTAVIDREVPEDERYALATPQGELVLQVDNPQVSFEINKFYYLDFTPAEGQYS